MSAVRWAAAAGIAGSVGLTAAIALGLGLGVFMSPQPPTLEVFVLLVYPAIPVLESTIGAVIEWRRPGHRIGRLLLVSGPLLAVVMAGWASLRDLEGVTDPFAFQVARWLVYVSSVPALMLIAGWLPLFFPTGRLPGPRWRVPVAGLAILYVVSQAAAALQPGPLADGLSGSNPFGVAGWPTALQPLVDSLYLQTVVWFLVAVAGTVVRYRRGDPVQQAQIRWLVAAMCIVAVAFAANLVEGLVRHDSGMRISIVVALSGVLLVPVAIGIAVLRYRLYDIDRIVSRTISYGVITALLVAVYGGLVLLLQAPLGAVTGGDTVAVAASTLVAAALFQPLRRRIQVAVDRRFDRARYDGERTAASFAAVLRDEVDPTHARSALLAAVDAALGPHGAAVWIRGETR